MKVYSFLKSVSKSKSRFVTVSVLALLFLSMFASLTVPSVKAAVLFQSGFESGSFTGDGWSGTMTSGGSATVETGAKHWGDYGANFTCNGGMQYEQACAYYDFTSGQPTLFMNYWWQLKGNFPKSGMIFVLGEFWDTTPHKHPSLSLLNDSGTYKWQLSYWNGTQNQIISNSTPTISLDTWYNIEIGYMQGSSGNVSLWVNGVKVLEAIYDNSGLEKPYRCVVGEYSDGAQTQKHTMLIDDVQIADSYIGYTFQSTPSFRRLFYNQTRAGNVTLFSVEVRSDTGLSGWQFEHNATGTFQNTTWQPLSGVGVWKPINTTLTLPSSVGSVVCTRWHCNNTDNEWGSTGWVNITTTSVPAVDLKTVGKNIVRTSDGSVVILKGFNLRDFCFEGYPHGVWFQIGGVTEDSAWNETTIKAHLDAIRTWNANLIRVIFCVEYWQYNTSGYITNFKQLAQWARERGLYMLMVPYTVQISGGQPELPYPPYSNPGDDQFIASEDKFIEFWVNVTLQMRNCPNVMYEIWNEPHGDGIDSWLGTYDTSGVAERTMMAMRNYTDQIIMCHWGYATDKNAHLSDWVNLIYFNQSYNFVISTHNYRNGYEAWWSHEYADLKNNMNVSGYFSVNVPLFITEIGLDLEASNLEDEKTWFSNALRIFNENNISWNVHGWHHYGVYRIFNYTQATTMVKWGWIPETEVTGNIIIKAMNSQPFVWSVGNGTLHGYKYIYSNNTAWSSTWSNNQLTITYSGDCEARIFWNVSESYPINSSLVCVHSNGTMVNAIDYYDPATNLIRLPSSAGGLWTITYSTAYYFQGILIPDYGTYISFAYALDTQGVIPQSDRVTLKNARVGSEPERADVTLTVKNANLTISQLSHNKQFIAELNGLTGTVAELAITHSLYTSMPGTVAVDGIPLTTPCATKTEFDSYGGNTWYYDTTTNTVYIKAVLHSPTSIYIDWNPAPAPPPAPTQLQGNWYINDIAITSITQTIYSSSTITFKFVKTAGIDDSYISCWVEEGGTKILTLTLTDTTNHIWTGTYTFTPGTHNLAIKAYDGTTTITYSVVGLTIPIITPTPTIPTWAPILIIALIIIAMLIIRKRL
jgi:hypothetical protein